MSEQSHTKDGLKMVSHLQELADCIPAAGKPMPVVVALGVFDGVHVGHQAVIRKLLAMGRAEGAVPVAMFFEPHPRMVLGRGPCPKRLTALEDKIALLGKLGIEAVVCMPFDRELAALSPEEFVRLHLQVPGIRLCGFCVGDDWRFGHLNVGDGRLLQQLSGVKVSIVPAVQSGGRPVSSTRIREALEQGDMEESFRLLGRCFSLHGQVRHGQGKGGSVLSTPTANVLGESVQLPRFGVYAARGVVDGVRHDGIVYVGDAPTLRGKEVIVELHLFGFTGDLYGQDLTVEFVSYLRESRLFADAASLQAQIVRDIVAAQRVLGVSHA